MRRSSVRLAIGLLLLIAALVALAPATIVDAALASRTHGQWRIAGASGRWWHGRGILASADGQARMPVAWRVAVLQLLRGEVSIELDPEGGAARGTVDLRAGGLSLHDLALRVPAALVAALAPRKAPLVVGGTLDLDAAAFEWTPTGGSGSLAAQWQRARAVVAGTPVDLGTVSLALAPRAGRLSGTLSNAGGDLGIEGTLSGSTGSIDAAMTLRPSSSTPEVLRRGLPMLGAQDATGAVHMAWHGGW
ncbi:MAG: type II secretion system protein N [Betaproteobacteria bacterium]